MAAVSGPDYVIVLRMCCMWRSGKRRIGHSAGSSRRQDFAALLNDVQAAGLTPMQLADSLTEKLKKFVASPRVTVVVTAINSKRIYMMGEVSHTGAIPMLPNMTVLRGFVECGTDAVRKHQEDLCNADAERQTTQTTRELPQTG